tara:strand:+ start:843 stop:1133 length:291 start_codon:yes stop_codon:yes gene_type:complete
LILALYLQGFTLDKEYEIEKSLLDESLHFKLLGKILAVKSAEKSRALGGKGITIRKTADVIIATFFIDRKFPLLFSDRDFTPFVTPFGLNKVCCLA